MTAFKPVPLNTLVLCGIGTVGKGIVELLPRFLKVSRLYILDKVEDLQETVDNVIKNALPDVQIELGKIEIICRVVSLGPSTVHSILEPLLADQNCSALMDLTTCVDSETMARIAESNNCVYINACLETFGEDADNSEGLRHLAWRQLKKEFKNTMLIETGMNPGLVSFMLKRALRDSGFSRDEIYSVHVTEYDTHKLTSPDYQNNFYCTWSPFGLYEEAVKKAEMAWSDKLDQLPPDWVRVEGSSMVVHSKHSGMQVQMQSVTPKWIDHDKWAWSKYYGFVVTHGEIETMSFMLDKNIHAAFVFHVPPDSAESMRRWRFNHAPRYTQMFGDMNLDTEQHVSADNIGVLVRTKSGRAWWTGSLMQNKEGQRVGGPLNNGANITVSSACLSSIAWALRHPNRGCLWPDEVTEADAEEMLTACEPYLGRLVSEEVPQEVLPPLKPELLYSEVGCLRPDPE